MLFIFIRETEASGHMLVRVSHGDVVLSTVHRSWHRYAENDFFFPTSFAVFSAQNVS